MARRKSNGKAGAAGVGVLVGVLVLCCGGVGALTDDDEPSRPSRPAPAVVVPTTPAVEETTEEPEPVEEPEEPVEDDDDDEPRRGVTAGAYCSTPGAVGFTKRGVRVTCKGPGRERWRR